MLKFNHTAKNRTGTNTLVVIREGKEVGKYDSSVWESCQRSEVTGEVVVRLKMKLLGSDLHGYASNNTSPVETFLVGEPHLNFRK